LLPVLTLMTCAHKDDGADSDHFNAREMMLVVRN